MLDNGKASTDVELDSLPVFVINARTTSDGISVRRCVPWTWTCTYLHKGTLSRPARRAYRPLRYGKNVLYSANRPEHSWPGTYADI